MHAVAWRDVLFELHVTSGQINENSRHFGMTQPTRYFHHFAGVLIEDDSFLGLLHAKI